MKKNLLALFCALSALSFIPSSVMAEDYTIEPKADGADAIKSRAVPLFYNTGNTWGSVTQQIYLASELTGQEAGAGDINAITFYYTANTTDITSNPSDRDIQIFLMEIPAEQNAFDIKVANGKSDFLYVSNTNKTAGTRVYNGSLTTEAVTTSQTKTVKINFDNSFAWDGSSNLVLTVFDMSATSNTVSAGGFANIRFLISKTETPRFLSWKWFATNDDDRAAWIADMSNNLAGREGEYWNSTTSAEDQSKNRSYVNKVDFSITPAAVPTAPATPEDLAASPATTSASISWGAVSGATSYDLQQSANGSDWSDLASSISGTSYNWTGLSASTTYYVRVRAVNAVGNSDWSDGISFTTDAVHSHNGINFERWNSTNSLPTSGNYYLNDDVELSAGISLSGNLNLCLNGHSVFSENNITIFTVPDEKTLAIYDNIGGGRIYGYYESAPLSPAGLITIESGGALVIGEGAIQNLDVDLEDGYSAYAIYNQGTLHMSGNPVITAATADIYLFTSKYITLDGELTNTSKYKVNAAGQVITSGWSTHMSGEKPSDYFTSAKSGYRGICVVSNEVKFVKLLALDEEEDNADISDGTYSGTICVSMDRSLTSSQFNTFCLPFALSNAQLVDIFGVGYDLEELSSSSLDGELLTLVFNRVYELEAGKPYLLQPTSNVADPSFEGVTITATSPVNVTTSYIDFKPVYGPTSLTGGNHNLLFLGAGNELFWPENTGNLNGFRAYFELKGAAPSAARRARIVQQGNTATGIESQQLKANSQKLIKNGQLLILRDNKTYNVLGMECK